MDDKIKSVTHLVLEGWLQTLKSLFKLEPFNKLTLETFFKVAIEFLLFDLHFCDIQIFTLIGAKERDIIMNGVMGRLFKIIKSTDEKFWLEKFGQLTVDNFDQYFDYFSKVAPSEDFIQKYNERQVEYSAYKKTYAIDENPKGTLTWEFGKKIAILVSGGPDASTVFSVQILSTDSLVFYSKTLKLIFGPVSE